MMRRALIGLLLAALLICCSGVSAEKVKDLTDTTHAGDRLLIGTTTSLDATGALDELSKKFADENNISVEWVAVGTGQAIKYGENGDVDLIMVHDRVAEDKFLDAGYGLDRRVFASNYFLVAGPESDPAKIAGLTATEAFKAIEMAGTTDAKVVFVSRGDSSGTHSREKLLWKAAGYDYTEVNKSPWYIDAAAGMGQTLNMANEMDAYTLADSATWNTMESNLSIKPYITDGKDLLNIYAVIRVNPDKFPNVGINVDAGKKWTNFLISDETQKFFADFQKDGKPLFVPAKGDAVTLNVTEEEISSPVE
ncbi:MAG: tungsten ABC transporter substrate-binding protein [Methanomicrobiales archaeon HGW-Methanomicrobiales-4]|nr:MAG: tungsten ABC transporter substrate-binding protein [Methanomicrobiales archaeon HGW-Methanomicrobiales-4]